MSLGLRKVSYKAKEQMKISNFIKKTVAVTASIFLGNSRIIPLDSFYIEDRCILTSSPKFTRDLGAQVGFELPFLG